MCKLKGYVFCFVALLGLAAISPVFAGLGIPHRSGPAGEEPLLYGLAALGLGWLARRVWRGRKRQTGN
jgi:biotin transporter BioY